MYLGFAAGWIGLWIVFGAAHPAAIAAVTAVALGVHLFVVFYEEPTLRGKFGPTTTAIVRTWRDGGRMHAAGIRRNSTPRGR